MYLFYKTQELFELLELLLKKGRAEDYTFSICFEHDEECQEFSKKLWSAYNVIAHGLKEDGFLEDQTIIIDSDLHKKDIAIVIGNAQFQDLGWKKVFFVNSGEKYDGKFYEYKNKGWKELSLEEYYA